ncbi:MAG: hypothetical protein EPN97_12840 [Alphaproteobacteria bacterium]|nr:MAG: hypothetical protein EPN97_12840 [Alphaproteobacteria bacterium]
MMDYRQSGLPQNDMAVFKAYSTYAKNAKSLPEETGLSEDFGIKIAQAINTATNGDSNLVTLALLSTTPPAAWGVVERSFGKEIVGQMEESVKHSRTGYAYIEQASEPVKLLALASAIALFDELKAKNDKAAAQLENLAGGMNDMNALESILPGMIQGMLPDTSVYGQLARSLADKTTCPQLEQLFSEKLEEFKFAQAEQQEKLAQFGIIIGGPGMGPMGAPSEVRYPSFEETGLLDDPKVRAVYDVITSNPRVQPDSFEGAVAAGKLLTDLPASKNPLAVAGALLDVGIRDLNSDDFEFLDKKLDWDVIDLVKNYSTHNPLMQGKLASAPVEARQIVVANLTAQLGHVREGVQGMLDRMEQPPADMPEGMEMPPELKRMMEMQAMQQLTGVSALAQRAVRPLLGTLDAPELEAEFKKNVQALQEFVAAHTPKEPKMLPPANDQDLDFPRRKKPGNDFSFD